jgi:hypothetical protein
MPETAPGFPREKRPWKCRRDLEDCTRAQPCPSCRGARNRRSGMRKQREARKALEQTSGTIAARFVGQLGAEESWHGLPVRVEVKSGAAAKVVQTKYRLAREQSDASKAIGDCRPFLFVAMPPGTTDGLAVIALSELSALLEALS